MRKSNVVIFLISFIVSYQIMRQTTEPLEAFLSVMVIVTVMAALIVGIVRIGDMLAGRDNCE